ncbi:hypothetical protein [Streptomyces sp. NPDC002779]|uniref:hypothetical protein n=1 Tax=Streptomyces sp. NPDC002779 TaxID=3364664 RepID=UPI0036A1078B
MAASAHLLLTALSKPEALTGPEPHVCVFSAESACAERPLTSEPPLPDTEPLTSEPPLYEAPPLTSEPPLADFAPLTSEAFPVGTDTTRP